VIVLVINFVLRNRRWVALSQTKRATVTRDFLCWRDLPRVGRELLGEEAAYEREMREEPAWDEKMGWGLPDTEHAGVHFKKSVARSLWLVESFAVTAMRGRGSTDGAGVSITMGSEHKADATGLPRASGAVDVGEYLGRLRRTFPDLTHDTCRQYLAFYKAARTAERELSVGEYDAFARILTDIRRCIQPRPGR